ncbi:hypothetical protein ABIC59_001204 [Priestia aryabhattai]
MKKSVLPIFFIVNLFFIYCLLFNQGYIFQLKNLSYIWAIYLLTSWHLFSFLLYAAIQTKKRRTGVAFNRHFNYKH